MIHYDIPEPELSPDFTLADIHKIRERNAGKNGRAAMTVNKFIRSDSDSYRIKGK